MAAIVTLGTTSIRC